MANEQVLTAEQVLEKASQYCLADGDIELMARAYEYALMHIANNIENRVNHILFIQFKLQEYWLIYTWIRLQ